MKTLLTGATGFLGSHFLFQRLGHGGGTIALVRAASSSEGHARLLRSLAVAADGYASRPMPIRHEIDAEPGDVARPFCGIAAERRRALRSIGVDEFWHFAASLAFEEHKRSAIFEQNVGGALNALDLATELGVRRFVYVSTAYTAGRRAGFIPERLHAADSTFNNAYEETKCIAEHEVSRRAHERGIDCRILRPAIVVGSSRTFSPAGSETGLYGFLRAIHGVHRELRLAGPLRLNGDPTTPLHFVAVDRVTAAMDSLAAQGFPGGPIHHLTPRRPLAAAQLLEVVCGALDTPGIRIEPSTGGDRSDLERSIDRHMEFYGAYLRAPKTFERSFPAELELGADDIEGLVRRWLRERETEADSRVEEELSRDRPCRAASRSAARISVDRAAARP